MAGESESLSTLAEGRRDEQPEGRGEGHEMASKLEKRERWLDLPPSNHLAAALKEQFHTGQNVVGEATNNRHPRKNI